jgi:hypothetical protein
MFFRPDFEATPFRERGSWRTLFIVLPACTFSNKPLATLATSLSPMQNTCGATQICAPDVYKHGK